MDYLTIDKEYSYELIVQKSKFISFIFPCSSIEEFQEKYKLIKKKYHDATHIIPAYRIISESNIIKEHFSDDREPAKTAGWPVLYILKQKSIVQVGVLVVRYFGGIKLGTSGLQKAYSEVLLNGIKNANLKPYLKLKEVKIKILIEKEHLIHEILKNRINDEKIKILNISYFEEKKLNYALISLVTDENTIKDLSSLLREKISNIEILY